MNIWIVIPTFNERENLPLISQVVLDLPLLNVAILNVDDDSPDGTGTIAESIKKKHPGRFECLHRIGRRGLGSAYLEGFHAALDLGAEMIGQMDADFSHPVDKIPLLLRELDFCDVVIGSRYVPSGSLDDTWSPFRKWLSRFGNWYARSILRMPVRDVTGGFKLWRREMLERMPLQMVRSNGYVFQVEMNYLAQKLNAKFSEIPIHFAERVHGRSKMSFRIQVEAALQVWSLPGRYRNLPKREISSPD